MRCVGVDLEFRESYIWRHALSGEHLRPQKSQRVRIINSDSRGGRLGPFLVTGRIRRELATVPGLYNWSEVGSFFAVSYIRHEIIKLYLKMMNEMPIPRP